MVFGLRSDYAVRFSRIGSMFLAALLTVGLAEGAPRGRLFGPLRGDSGDDRESKKTYSQPRELQRQRPIEPATPAPAPQSAPKPSASLSADSAESLPIGDPLSAGKVALAVQEMAAAIRSRQLESEFSRWESYLASCVDASSGKSAGSELNGNCRLQWYDRLMRKATTAPAGRGTLHTPVARSAWLGRAGRIRCRPANRTRKARLALAATHPNDAYSQDLCPSPGDTATSARRCARASYLSALAPLTEAEISELSSRSCSVFVGRNDVRRTH